MHDLLKVVKPILIIILVLSVLETDLHDLLNQTQIFGTKMWQWVKGATAILNDSWCR